MTPWLSGNDGRFDFGATPEAPTDPRGYLKRRLFEAKFPILSANIARADSSEIDWPNLQSDTTLKIGNLTIGVIGVSTVETSYTTHPRNVVRLKVPRPIISKSLRRALELRSNGAGCDCDDWCTSGRCAKISVTP